MFVGVWNTASIAEYFPPLLTVMIAVSLLPAIPAHETYGIHLYYLVRIRKLRSFI